MHYFVSDVHLGSGDVAEQRRVERLFLDFLKRIEKDAETLYLVGDIFDFWFEYKEVVPKGFVRVLGRLAELSDKGIKIVMLTGNHDMWVGDYLTQECGITIYTKPQIFKVAGKELLVAHGDNINIKWRPMLRLMNKMFRSTGLRKFVSRIIHPDRFVRFGKWWSGKSRKSHSMEQITPSSLGFLIDYARDYKQANPETDYILFGHMHYAHDHNSDGLRVLFLSDWEQQCPTYAVLDCEGNFTLKTFGL